jgi:C1A family cysteine protease
MKRKFFVLTVILIMVTSCFGAADTINVKLEDDTCSCSETITDLEDTQSGLTQEDIANIQEEINQKGYSFTVGESNATRRSIDELCGLVEPEDWGDEYISDITLKEGLPDEFDWSNPSENYVGRKCTTYIKDQGNCGSCWAFGTVGPLESAILIKEGVTTDLSEQWLVSCNTGGYGCDGGWWAHKWHAGTTGKCGGTGAILENEFPYVASDVSCGGFYNHIFLVKEWYYITDRNSVPTVGQIKQAIYDYGPISVAVHVDSAFQAYTSGVFDSPGDGGINHAVVLVGWNNDPGYWILRNSWGSGWGESGYMRIAYGSHSVGYAACYIKEYEKMVEEETTVNTYIKKITNEGSGFDPIDPIGFTEPEWYYTVKIGSEYSETNENIKEGTDGFWPWEWKSQYTWNVEQGHVGQVDEGDVQIKIDVWDNDVGPTDDHADINPKSGRTFTGNYNLVTDVLVFSDGDEVPTEGNYYSITGNENDNAKVLFKVTDSYDAEKYKPKLSTDPSSKINFGTIKDGKPTESLNIINSATNDPRGWAPKLEWTASDDQSWITLSKTSGSLSGGSSDSVTVTANADDLSKGEHTGKITINSNGGTKTLNVEITIEKKAKSKTMVDSFRYIFNQKILLYFFQ